MKNKISTYLKTSVLLPALALACLTVTAQRGDRNGNGAGNNRGGGVQQDRPSVSQPRPGNIQSRDMVQSQPDRRDYGSRNPQNNNPGVTPTQRPSRTFSNTPDDRNGNTRPSTNTAIRPDQRDRHDNNGSRYGNNYGYNRTNNNTSQQRYGSNYNRNNNYYGKSGYYSTQRRQYYGDPFRYSYYYPNYGQRFTRLSFNYNVISFGGIGYCYNSGIFYRPFQNYYQVVAPPIGISINRLPFGYSRVFYGNDPYYFYGNTYYRQYNNSYQVVEPPIGAKLPALPRGAKQVNIDGERFFEDNGTYYFEEFNEKNERLYTVVGVNGVLNNEQVNRILNSANISDVNTRNQGKVYSSLPANSKKVTIEGHEYFRSPDEVYYQEITDGKNTNYQVVGN